MKTDKGFVAATGSLMLTPVLASGAGRGSAAEMAALAAKMPRRVEDGLTICASEILTGLMGARLGIVGRGRPN
jgi:hypothetical protein